MCNISNCHAFLGIFFFLFCWSLLFVRLSWSKHYVLVWAIELFILFIWFDKPNI
ncbi:hypothetical protein HanLR1_Chr12g0454111 [Helianthus annuus]|nr:hypothetical protein HanHA89_Chr12g0477221 [Helianthus annuus]KAJ0675700.1 hypothetical protein HanLR1_Chr12g0454111 [Helianthus annuus]